MYISTRFMRFWICPQYVTTCFFHREFECGAVLCSFSLISNDGRQIEVCRVYIKLFCSVPNIPYITCKKHVKLWWLQFRQSTKKSLPTPLPQRVLPLSRESQFPGWSVDGFVSFARIWLFSGIDGISFEKITYPIRLPFLLVKFAWFYRILKYLER